MNISDGSQKAHKEFKKWVKDSKKINDKFTKKYEMTADECLFMTIEGIIRAIKELKK